MKIIIDYAGLDEVLKAKMRGPVDEAAAQIAEKLLADPEVADDAQGNVKVLSTIHDRAVAIVAIAHPAGDAIQAKYGSLTKAAAACGYEVHAAGLVNYVSKSGHKSQITPKQAANYGGGA